MSERTIFLTALEKRDPAERASYLGNACAGDLILRQRVEALLRSHDDAGSFLEAPIGEQLAAEAGPTLDHTDPAEPLPGANAEASGGTQTEMPCRADPGLEF